MTAAKQSPEFFQRVKAIVLRGAGRHFVAGHGGPRGRDINNKSVANHGVAA